MSHLNVKWDLSDIGVSRVAHFRLVPVAALVPSPSWPSRRNRTSTVTAQYEILGTSASNSTPIRRIEDSELVLQDIVANPAKTSSKTRIDYKSNASGQMESCGPAKKK